MVTGAGNEIVADTSLGWQGGSHVVPVVEDKLKDYVIYTCVCVCVLYI